MLVEASQFDRSVRDIRQVCPTSFDLWISSQIFGFLALPKRVSIWVKCLNLNRLHGIGPSGHKTCADSDDHLSITQLSCDFSV